MKKFLLSIGLVAGLFASDKLISQTELNNVLKATPIYGKLKADEKRGMIEKIRGVKKDGFYIIQIIAKRGQGVIYVTADKKYTILGRVIDNKSGQIVRANFPVNKDIVKNGISFTFGHGKKEIYVVTDPECPFCRRMEAQTKDKLAKDYTVHVILFPLPFHRYARAMSYYILAGKTDAEKAKRFKAVLGGSDEWKNYKPTPQERAKFLKELQKSKKAVEELGARGTPTVYDQNFNQIDWTTLTGAKK